MTPLLTGGTRFRLFPNYASGFAEPETVSVMLPPGTIGAGPADPWMYTVHPVDKTTPYDPPRYVPPYRGPVFAPAMPDSAGHFDHIPVESEQFMAAHLYGATRMTLDIWQNYLRRRVVWWDAAVRPQLELVTNVQWDNAQSGPGFLETGRRYNHYGRPAPFCLNFDVIAHETGHAILFSQIGVPRPEDVTRGFLSFHESFSDLVALVGALHFDGVCRRLLEQTEGNLYALNLVNRIGEISDTEQIRRADNLVTIDDVADITLAPDGTWIDPSGRGRNNHAIAEPLTGAIFDNLVDIYQDGLVSRGLILPHADARGWTEDAVSGAMDRFRGESAEAFARFTRGFYESLAHAREIIGRCMAHVMLTMHPETLNFGLVAARFLEAAAALGQAGNMWDLLDNFLWRGIDPRPYLTIAIAPGARRRGSEPRGRLAVREPPNHGPRCGCGDAHGAWWTRRLMPHPQRAEPV